MLACKVAIKENIMLKFRFIILISWSGKNLDVLFNRYVHILLNPLEDFVRRCRQLGIHRFLQLSV